MLYVQNNFQKEASLLLSTVDRFFGTSQGFPCKTVVHAEYDLEGNNIGTKDVQQPDTTQCNIFVRMKELGLMICGGAISSLFTESQVNDLDFYMIYPEKKEECINFLRSIFVDKTFYSKNAITLKRKSPYSRRVYSVQLITRFSGEPSEIFDWFDFTITHGAYRFDTNSFEFGDRFFSDLSRRRLVYSGASMYPICAMYRTKKYVDRGYKLSGATVMHIALSIVQLKIENYAQLKEQLMGIDTMYLQKLLEAKNPDAPVDYGEFVSEAFKRIDQISGLTAAEEEDDEILPF